MNNKWSKLTNLERNLLVGLEVMNFNNGHSSIIEWKKSFQYHHDLGIWNYSTNPRQAYDILEKLIDEGYVVEIKIISSNQFLCKFAHTTDLLSETLYSEGESFQESVCLAALRSKGIML